MLLLRPLAGDAAPGAPAQDPVQASSHRRRRQQHDQPERARPILQPPVRPEPERQVADGICVGDTPGGDGTAGQQRQVALEVRHQLRIAHCLDQRLNRLRRAAEQGDDGTWLIGLGGSRADHDRTAVAQRRIERGSGLLPRLAGAAAEQLLDPVQGTG